MYDSGLIHAYPSTSTLSSHFKDLGPSSPPFSFKSSPCENPLFKAGLEQAAIGEKPKLLFVALQLERVGFHGENSGAKGKKKVFQRGALK